MNKQIKALRMELIELIEERESIDEWYDEQEELSDCCGAELYEETDICTDCKEHTGQ